MKPVWKNFFENTATVQFDHRVLAKLTLVSAAITFWLNARLKTETSKRASIAVQTMFSMAMLQFGLGVTALVATVPPSLGVLHQAGAVALLTSTLWAAHVTRTGRIMSRRK